MQIGLRGGAGIVVVLGCLVASGVVGGCAARQDVPPRRPSVAPGRPVGSEALRLDRSQIGPMYRELLAIDLPTVTRVAQARNIDIRQARARIEASEGRYEAAFGAIFPVISPTLSYEHLQGSVRAVDGPLLKADFNAFAPQALVQWALNPGRVIYDIIASRKRLDASKQDERFTRQDVLRISAVQYYDLVLAQAKLAVANQAVAEAEELLRITEQRVRAGAGLPADQLRAQATLASRRQDLALALNGLYQASIALTVTLHLDSTVTLVPSAELVPQLTLVRDDLTLDDLLAMAVQWRPDLQSVRQVAAAAAAERGSAAWGALGPQIQAGYSFGGIGSQVRRFPNQTFGIHEQERFTASAGWSFGLATLGYLKTAGALEKQAALDALRQVDVVRSQVVRASQESRTQGKLVPLARQQVTAAEEALRLAQANLQAGTMLVLDVLQAEDEVSNARLRYAQAVTSYNRSQVDLLAALGLLDEESLSVPDQTPTTAPETAPSTQPVTPDR